VQYVMIADTQALTDHASHPKEIREHVMQVALDYLSVGIDPGHTTIFIQSLIPPLSELTMHYLNLVTWNRLKHNPTVKQEIMQKSFGEGVPAGFMIYPVAQASDITAFKATLIPVGKDQKPMIEQTNEIVRAFNRTYSTDVLCEVEAMIPKISRLPGTDGQEKMGKSLYNAIYLCDDPDTVTQKVFKMCSDPNHQRIEDPGCVESSPVFCYLDAFGEDLDKIAELKAHYRRGGLGDRVVKEYLSEVIHEFLEPIRQRRQQYENDLYSLNLMLMEGSQVALQAATETLDEVRRAMHLPKTLSL